MEITNVSKINHQLTFDVKVDSETWKKELNNVLKQLAKNVNIQGFRKGKVPASLAHRQVKGRAFQTAINNLVPSILKEIETANQNRTDLPEIIDEPSFNVLNVNDDNLEIQVIYDQMPSISTKDMSDFDIDFKKLQTVSKKDIDAEIERILKRNKKIVNIDRNELKEGDIALIDFKGYIDGKPFAGGEAQNYSLRIGSKQFIDNFEEQLIGLKVGESRDVNVRFPKEYHASQMANKPAKFEVKLNAIQKEEEYKLDDEFIKSLALDGVNTVKELEDYIKTQFEKRNMSIFKDTIKKDLIRSIAESTELSFIPSNSLNFEKQRIRQIIEKQAKDQKTTLQKSLSDNNVSEAQLDESITNDATNSLKYVFTIQKIASDNNIVFSDSEYEEYIQNLARLYGMNHLELMARFKQNEENIREELLNEKILDFIIDNNKNNPLNKKK